MSQRVACHGGKERMRVETTEYLKDGVGVIRIDFTERHGEP